MRRYLGIDADKNTLIASDEKIGSRAKLLIDSAIQLLSNEDWGLPTICMSAIAASTKSSPFFFLLLVWLDLMLDEHKRFTELAKIDDERRRLVVGAVTVAGWFCERSGDCLSALWKQMRECIDQNRIEAFFSQGMMRKSLVSEGRRVLLPILPPRYVYAVIQKEIYDHDSFDIGKGGIWDEPWNRWHSLKMASCAVNWFDEYDIPSDEFHTTKVEVISSLTQGLMGNFLGAKELLHYAQRRQLRLWFPDYDPTSPDQLEDTDRPWDYDHVFPSAYGQVNSLPSLIKEWFASIGNLRVWPLEANRAGGCAHPAAKLSNPIPQENAAPYDLQSGEQIRLASHIYEDCWPYWRGSTPHGEPPDRHRYLADPKNYDEQLCRPSFVRAVSLRFLSLYSEWHNELRIESLFRPLH